MKCIMGHGTTIRVLLQVCSDGWYSSLVVALLRCFSLKKFCVVAPNAAINFLHQCIDMNLIVISVLTSSLSSNLCSHFNTAFSTAGFSRSVAKTAAVSGSVVSKVRVFLLVKFDISLIIKVGFWLTLKLCCFIFLFFTTEHTFRFMHVPFMR